MLAKAMAGSPFFARIRGDVLAILRAVPPGAAVSYADIGAWLDVPARHVAYILKMLPDPEAEGVDPERAVAATSRHPNLLPVAALDHGVPRQTRPADAPVPRLRKQR